MRSIEHDGEVAESLGPVGLFRFPTPFRLHILNSRELEFRMRRNLATVELPADAAKSGNASTDPLTRHLSHLLSVLLP
jgi:hypothetical protein